MRAARFVGFIAGVWSATLAIMLLTAGSSVGISGGKGGPPGHSSVRINNSTGVASTATLIAQLSTAGAYASPVSITAGGPITDTRASIATYLTGLTMGTASANQLRVQPNGFLNEPSSTNIALQSGDLSNAAWTTFNTLTITPNTCIGPTGATDMALIDSTAAGAGTQNQRYQLPATGATASQTNSVWLNVTSGSHTGGVVAFRTTLASCSCTCACMDGTACTCTTSANSAACTARATVDRLCRLSATATDTGTSNNGEISTFAGVDGVSNDAICIGYAQNEMLPFMTSYIATAGTATTRATETATVPAVGNVGAATGSGVFQFTPEWSSATAGGDRVLLATSGLTLKWLNSGTAIALVTGGATATSASLTWTAGSSHSIRYRYGGGAGSGACVQVDGASEVCNGTFSGLTPTDPLYLNGDASGGAGGSMSGLKVCPGNSPCN